VRIAIDVRKLHDYGIGTYVRNLLRQLARIDPQRGYRLICQPNDEVIERRGELPRHPTGSGAPTASSSRSPDPPARALLMSSTPHYVPPLLTPPVVVTIHDCIHDSRQHLPNRMAARLFL
jgi:hypothetical protein